jgi:hypothetical protein
MGAAWMTLTGWAEKGPVEKFLFALEAPFTILRSLIPSFLLSHAKLTPS